MCWFSGSTNCCCCGGGGSCSGCCGCCGSGGGSACSVETALTSCCKDWPKEEILCDCAVIAC